MRSFRVEFDEFFENGLISMIVVGLGPCGELRYPFNPVKHGWRYPGIGEFQVVMILLNLFKVYNLLFLQQSLTLGTLLHVQFNMRTLFQW